MTGAGTPKQANRDLDSLTLGAIRLEELVDRDSLNEVVRSFSVLFGISTRIFSAEGQLLADCYEQQPLCQCVNQTPEGRAACGAVVGAVKRLSPPLDGQQAHACFTGANYHVSPLSYDGRAIGKIILGPYLPGDLREIPGSLLATVRCLQPDQIRELLPKIPRARASTISQISGHLRSVLDLILFSGHKALLTSQMHLASVRESYRELQDKNSQLQDAFDKLRELDRLKSNFIATISHELRTPLTSIIGYSEMLGEGIAGQMTTEQIEFVQTIREKGEQLLRLIMSLLDMSKLESGTVSLQKADIDTFEMLSDVASSLRPAARKKSIQLSVSQPTEPIPRLVADASKLRQALLNLADNALKFTPSGGQVKLSASLASDTTESADVEGFTLLSPTRKCIEIRVADTGIGIPQRERQKVFDAFYQVDSSSTREYGGTGLGLAIVKRLVEGHDGTIRIEDNQPVGTVFVVCLPVHPTRAT